jgi:hypothetical protein
MTISAAGYTDLFEDVGKMLKYLNVYRAYASTSLIADHDAIAVVLNTNLRYDILSGLPEQYVGFRDGATGWVNSLASRIERRLMHFDTIINNLPITGVAGIQEVLAELIVDMITEEEDVKACVVTIGAVAADPENAGDATVLTTKILDGYSSPRAGFPPHMSYRGINSQLAVTSETIMLVASTDSKTGATEGREQWSVAGSTTGSSSFDWRNEGSGNGPTITTGNGAGILTNGGFESFSTANTPDNWTIGGGVPGTDIFKETSSVKRGISALKFTGDGIVDPLLISQAVSSTQVNTKRSYCVACWVKGTAGIVAGNLLIQFSGTGYTPGVTEKINMDATALAAQTTYGLKSFFVNIPADIPSNFALEIRITGGLTAAKDVLIDGLVLTPTTWHGGIGIAIVAGATPVIIGDRFSFSVANDNAGVFQTFMRKKFGIQLPSQTDASETQPDSLAT